MGYTLDINGRQYELPKKTIDVEEQIDRIDDDNASKLKSKRKKYEGMFEFVKKMVGEDAAKEIFEVEDVSNINSIDLCTITISYLGIVRAYSNAVNTYKIDDAMAILDDSTIGKVVSLAKSVDTIQQASVQVQK